MNLRVDANLKNSAEKVVSDLGLSMSAAVVLFLKAVVREKGLPFDVKVSRKAKTKESQNPNIFLSPKKTKRKFDLPGSTSIKNAINKL
jgi:DNA-damage-inducible protein J